MPVDAVLFEPVPGRKAVEKKRLRFGEATVVSVSRWIELPDHIFSGIPSWFKGGRVTPLFESDEDGELKYTTSRGSDSYEMLISYDMGPCDGQNCAWNSQGHIWWRHSMWTPPMV